MGYHDLIFPANVTFLVTGGRVLSAPTCVRPCLVWAIGSAAWDNLSTDKEKTSLRFCTRWEQEQERQLQRIGRFGLPLSRATSAI